MGSPLIGRALRQSVAGIGVLIVVLTVSLHVYVRDALSSNALSTLVEYVRQRSERESRAFLNAEHNIARLKLAYLRELSRPPTAGMRAEFDRLFARSPDGVIRLRHPDPAELAGVFVPPDVALSDEVRRRTLADFQLATRFGLAWAGYYANTYIGSLDNVSATFFPAGDWAGAQSPDLQLKDMPWVIEASPLRNPSRRAVWTGIYFDPLAQRSSGGAEFHVSCVLPIDVDGKFSHYIGLDLPVEELVRRTQEVGLAGTSNMIFRADGQLISHPNLAERVAASNGAFNILGEGDPELLAIFRAATQSRGEGPHWVEVPGRDVFLGVARIKGPDWFFVTVYPKALIEAAGSQASYYLLLAAIVSLLGGAAVFWFVLRRQVAAPLARMQQAVNRTVHGEREVRLDEREHGEFGRLATSFNAMVSLLEQRESGCQQQREALSAALAARNAEQRVLWAMLPVAVFQLSASRTIQACNAAAGELFGYEPEELIGRSTRCLYPDNMAFLERAVLRDQVRGEMPSTELLLTRRDGSRFWCEVHGKAIDPADPNSGEIWIARDISARRPVDEDGNPLSGLPTSSLAV